MTVISNDGIRLMLYCSSFSLPLGLMIHLQVWIYFTMTVVILVLWDCPCLSPPEKKEMKPQLSLLLFLSSWKVEGSYQTPDKVTYANVTFMMELCRKKTQTKRIIFAFATIKNSRLSSPEKCP